MAGLQKSRENIKNFNSIYMEKSTEKCTKPDCDCLEIAEQKAGGQVKNYPCLVSVTEFTKKKSSEIEKICEHLNKNIKRQCDNEIKTGQTSVMCCNICGKPDEDFWDIGQDEIILCDYCGHLETEHEENCLKSPETKAQILIDSHKLYNDEQEAITHSLITVNMVKAVLPSGDLMAYYSRVRQILINRLNEYK